MSVIMKASPPGTRFAPYAPAGPAPLRRVSVIKKAGTEGTFEILFFSRARAGNLLEELLPG